MSDSYQQFIESKIQLAEPSGFDIDPAEISPLLKPHQRDIVRWALIGGLRVDVDERITRQQIAAELERQRQARFDRMWRPPFRVPPRPE